MKKTTVSLKYKKSATVFGGLKITQKGVGFISSEVNPELFNQGPNSGGQKQRHETRIALCLAYRDTLSTEMFCLDSDSDEEQAIVWGGYKISFAGLSGYTDTEVRLEIEEIPEAHVKSMRREKNEDVTVFNKREITAVLANNKPVIIFDTFSITLNGIKRSGVSSKPPPSSATSKETALFTLCLLDSSLSASIVESADVSMDIANTAPDFQIQPLYWQGYKFSYAGQDDKNNVLFLIAEVPDELDAPVVKKSLWKRLLS
ncbi:hypothetical protein MNBD_GAMMA11-2890 [hydrothermal vent metagenome]|uniref:Uncharacterized protein n=1 Tax=hydrothermal vent metagenome TaxID=652676 RepID=A0A3B0X0D7_9ZZZZ